MSTRKQVILPTRKQRVQYMRSMSCSASKNSRGNTPLHEILASRRFNFFECVNIMCNVDAAWL
jgi:hypothetical protein